MFDRIDFLNIHKLANILRRANLPNTMKLLSSEKMLARGSS
jgi:hypothetical protein